MDCEAPIIIHIFSLTMSPVNVFIYDKTVFSQHQIQNKVYRRSLIYLASYNNCVTAFKPGWVIQVNRLTFCPGQQLYIIVI